MCGIAGILGSHPNNKHVIKLMLEAQQHRGPDATNVWQDQFITLGHNRLSIIDLSNDANQPMISNCGNYCIIFNGEIYNYVELKAQLKNHYHFQTKSDTEVLLAAYILWGTNALEKLNGMFSFVIWNKKEKKLFIARDRFGVKPFYYTFFQSQFYFSSEIKTLFAANVPKMTNKKVLANYFVYATYGLPNETFFENIQQLPAGHFLYISSEQIEKNENLNPKKWYDFKNRINLTPQLPLKDLKLAYEDLLNDAIALRFRADVPLGMNVSGGLDSSTLISLVHQNLPSEKSIEAFTFYSNNNNYDELPWVEQLLAKLPYQLNKILVDYKSIPDLIKEIGHFQDEPYGGFPTIAYSLLFKAARSKGIKVILDGQGMDEAWAGYDYYFNKSDNIIQGTNSSPVRPEILSLDFFQFAEKEIYEKPFQNDLQNLQFRDLFYTKIPRALRFNDRISMMHSTELREPFLDYRLVELAFAQTDEMKMNDGKTKWLLRDLVKNQLGNNIVFAPKRPLQTPQREWIANELKPFFNQQIETFSTFDFVDKKAVQTIWKQYCNGATDNSFYIWQWVNINLFLQNNLF